MIPCSDELANTVALTECVFSNNTGSSLTEGGYRYGFNGKENDNEVKGEGNQQDYGFRIYDTRLGKFLSTDPLAAEYPWFTPYQFAGNTPIWAIDLDGKEPYYRNYWDNVVHQAKIAQIGKEEVERKKASPFYNFYKAAQRNNIEAKQFVFSKPLTKIEARAADYQKALEYEAQRAEKLKPSVLWNNFTNQVHDILAEPFRAYEDLERADNYVDGAKAAFRLGFSSATFLSGFLKFGSFSKLASTSNSAKLGLLQRKFDDLAEKYLLPKYKAIDPNLESGYTGSFKTGVVGSKAEYKKATYGKPINLNDYDIDYWIKSDELFNQYGKKLQPDEQFRNILLETPGFEGLRPGNKGFSIKFKPFKLSE